MGGAVAEAGEGAGPVAVKEDVGGGEEGVEVLAVGGVVEVEVEGVFAHVALRGEGRLVGVSGVGDDDG